MRSRVQQWVAQLKDVRGTLDAVGENYVTISTNVLDAHRLDTICQRLQGEQVPWMVSSVQRSACRQLVEWHQARRMGGVLRILTRADFPFGVHLDQPDRVGVDRLAAAFAAGWLKPIDLPAIVVDVGTAVTIDAVAVDGTFLGGAILPGVELASRALAVGTSQIPQLPRPMTPLSDSVIGRDTEQALTSGVYWGCLGGIERIVERMRSELGSTSVVFLTGGGSEYVAANLLFESEHQPDLVMVGMALACGPLVICN